LGISFWQKISTRIKRVLTVIIFFLLLLAATIVGALTPLTFEEREAINKELQKMRESLSSSGGIQGIALIFGNNFMLCLSFFIPFLGPLFGFYVLYNTGVVIAAESSSIGVNSLLTFILLFIFPFTWLEYLAYSAASAQSLWLGWRIIKRKGRRELVNTCILITICAVILLVAAMIEMAIISVFSQS
jgi:uncharacterized membrane protein SpoIIM required for sporulation